MIFSKYQYLLLLLQFLTILFVIGSINGAPQMIRYGYRPVRNSASFVPQPNLRNQREAAIDTAFGKER